jgi:hypothetical protein
VLGLAAGAQVAIFARPSATTTRPREMSSMG